MKDYFSFKLSNPIKVAIGSKLENIDTLYLKCFNIQDHRNITILLRNQYKRMIFDVVPIIDKLSKKETQSLNTEKQEQTAEDIQELFSIFDGEKFIEFLDRFIFFFKMNILFKDESLTQKVIDLDLNKINPNDTELLIAKYIEVFFLSSWMK